MKAETEIVGVMSCRCYSRDRIEGKMRLGCSAISRNGWGSQLAIQAIEIRLKMRGVPRSEVRQAMLLQITLFAGL